MVGRGKSSVWCFRGGIGLLRELLSDHAGALTRDFLLLGLNPRDIGTDRLPLWQTVILVVELLGDPHSYLNASRSGLVKRIPDMWPALALLTASVRAGLGQEHIELGREFLKPLEAPAVTDEMLADRLFLSEGMGITE